MKKLQKLQKLQKMQKMQKMQKKSAAEPEVVEPKRRPGRPSKVKKVDKSDIKGIISAPVNPANIVEFANDHAVVFKKLFKLFKSYNVSVITFDFQEKQFNIIGEDHKRQCLLFVRFNCENTRSYYVKEPLQVNVEHAQLATIFDLGSQNQYIVTFELQEDYRSRLGISIEQKNNGSVTNYKLGATADVEVFEYPDTVYPLTFTLNARDFKVDVAQYCKTSKKITIQREGQGPLRFITKMGDGNVSSSKEYRDMEKINTQSDMDDDDIINVHVGSSQVKPIANALIGDRVHLGVHNDHALLIKTDFVMDAKPVATVSVFITTESMA